MTAAASRVFVMEAMAVSFSFAAAAFHSDSPAFLDEPIGFVRLAIPVIPALFVILIRNAAAACGKRAQSAAFFDVTLAFAAAFLTEWAVSRFAPQLALARGWAPTQGGMAGILDLAISRALFPPGVRDREEFISEPSRAGIWIAAVTAVALAVAFGHAGTTRTRIGSGIALAGLIFIVWQLRHLTGASLRRVWYALLIAVLPGTVTYLWGSQIYNYFVIFVILLAMEWIQVQCRLYEFN